MSALWVHVPSSYNVLQCLDYDKTGWPFEKVKFFHPIQSPVDVVTSKAVTKDLPMLDIIEPSQQQNVKAKFYNSGSTGEYCHD